MRKRGQITLFVILGLLIVSIIAVGVYYRSKILKAEGESALAEESSLPPDVRNIRNDVKRCIDNVAKEGLIFLGYQAGYIDLPAYTAEFDNFAIPYLYYVGNLNVRNIEEIKADYSYYIDNHVLTCFNPEDYPNLNLEMYTPNTVVNFGDNVEVSTEFKIDIRKGDNVYNLYRPYKISYPVNFDKVYSTAKRVVQNIAMTKSLFNPTDLADLDRNLNVYKLDDGSLVYEVVDEDSKIDDKPYSFMFAVR